MNERLEKEIKSWLELRGIEHDEFGEIGKAALHFYSLATEDIRKRVEKRYKDIILPERGLTEAGKGYVVGVGDVLRFDID